MPTPEQVEAALKWADSEYTYRQRQDNDALKVLAQALRESEASYDKLKALCLDIQKDRDEQKARADASEARVMELMAGHHNWSQRAIKESNRGDAAEADALEQQRLGNKAWGECNDRWRASVEECSRLRAEVASLIKSTGEHVTVRAELRAENERMRKVLLWLIGPDGPLYGVDSQVLDRIQAALDKEAGHGG